MSATGSDARLQRLLDKQDITEVLYRYSRGVDRSDRAMLASVYWPDANDDHIVFQGKGDALIDYLHTAVREMRTQHRISNVLIDFESDDRAACESYVVAFHSMETGDGREDVLFAGRYMDRFERRNGEWRISDRRVIMDYFQRGKAAEDLGVFGALPVTGCDYPDDPLYTLVPALRGK